jgi:peroxiredoxin
MVTTESTIVAIGSQAPAFTLPDTVSTETVTLSQFASQPVLIAFICNHCPYVVHILDEFVNSAHEFAANNVATVAISANDADNYPADSPEKMSAIARQKGFSFPYCYDESQSVARAYDAVCTPDLFLFDANHKLFYRGQFDESRPGQGKSDGRDLKNAVSALLANEQPPSNAKPSVGCSIKWKR